MRSKLNETLSCVYLKSFDESKCKRSLKTIQLKLLFRLQNSSKIPIKKQTFN